MGDVFKEQLVKKVPSRKDALVKAALVAAGFFITIAVYFLLFQLLPMVLFGVGFLIYYLFSMMSREYEYIFTNGELEIDCVFGKSRRKRVIACNLKEILFMSHVSDATQEKELATAKTSLDCGSGVPGENTYVILLSNEGKRTKITFEPNEMMLSAMRPYLGSKKLFPGK